MALTADELKAIQEQSVPYSPANPTTPLPEGLPGQPLNPPPSEYYKALATGAAQGVTKGAPVAAGALTGLRLGMATGSPLAAVAGTALGAGAGLMAGEELDKLLWEDIAAAQRPEVAPYREGGKTFGETIAFAPAAFGLPVMTGNRVARFISMMGESARKAPRLYLSGESMAGIYAGGAGGTSYYYNPESKLQRFGAEIGAGMLAPMRLLSGAVSTAKGVLGGAFSSSGRQLAAENKAAATLKDILDQHGEDIPSLIAELQRPLPGSVPTPTSAQKTGRLVLSELENALSNLHVKFGADVEAQGRDALRAYSLLVDRLRQVGTPEALTEAAKLRSNAFEQMIAKRENDALENAARRVVKITRDTPAARAEIGEIVKAETSLALQNAREAEKALWDEALRQVTAPVTKVPTKEEIKAFEKQKKAWENSTLNWFQAPPSVPRTTIEAPKLAASNTFDAFLRRASEVPDSLYKNIDPAVRSIMQELGATQATVLAYKQAKKTPEYFETGAVKLPAAYKPKEVDVSELIGTRSHLLAMARDAAAGNKPSEAGLYGDLAEAILKDLEALKSPAFDAARDFSRALNDHFTRTYANVATAQGSRTATGAERVPAEILITRAFGRNADVTAQRMTQIEDAVKFMRTQYDQAVAKFGPKSDQALMLKPQAEMADQAVVSIQDAQARALRLMAAKTIDPLTGRVNPRALQGFVNENKPMLDKLGITNDLTDAVSAELALKLVANQNSKLNDTLRNQTMFAQVLAAKEKPSLAVADVLNGKQPVLGMNHLMKLASTGGPAAEQGLKSTLIDYAITKAGGMENFNPTAFRDTLFRPLGPNKPSIVGLLQQHGLMSRQEIVNVNELIKPMLRIEDAVANKRSLDEVLKGSDAVTDFAMRVIGSKLGSMVAPSGPGSLVAAGAGSKVVRQIFDKMPTMMTRATLEQAMQDPGLMALLLQKTTSPSSAFDVAKQLAARLATSGVLPASMINAIQPPPPEQQAPRPTAADMLKRMPPAPPVRGTPVLPSTPASGAGASGKVSQSPQEQTLYQALFPNDPLGSMMGLQTQAG